MTIIRHQPKYGACCRNSWHQMSLCVLYLQDSFNRFYYPHLTYLVYMIQRTVMKKNNYWYMLVCVYLFLWQSNHNFYTVLSENFLTHLVAIKVLQSYIWSCLLMCGEGAMVKEGKVGSNNLLKREYCFDYVYLFVRLFQLSDYQYYKECQLKSLPTLMKIGRILS